MKNKFYKIVVMALTVLMIASCLLISASCSCNPDNGGNPPDNGGGEYVPPDTTYDLIKDGETQYKIVIPAEATYNEKNAKDEFLVFFEQATGILPEVITDAGLTYSADSKYISIGNTTILKGSPVTLNPNMTKQGFQLATAGQNLIIAGGDEGGVIYGVYEFLHYTVGFEAYAPDEMATERNIRNKKVPDFDLTGDPDIMLRTPNYGSVNYNIVAANRMRYTSNIWMTEKGNFVHNTFSEYFRKATYETSNPEFYSYPNRDQLCYSGYGTNTGDTDSLATMQSITLERMKSIVSKYFDAGQFLESLSFTHEDNNVWCTCKKCAASKTKYKSDAAVLIHFINPVAKQLKEWLNEKYPGHDVNICIFAYTKTEKAPFTVVDGESVPVDDTVYLEDNVALFYAPYYANYHYDFDHKDNATYKETIQQWSKLSKKMYLWTYSTSFQNYVSWYDSFNSMQSIYQMAKQYNSYYIFDQGRYNCVGLTGFDHLKVYLNSKLAWDVDANVDKLTWNFFDNFFKDASQPMKDYFRDYRLWMEYVKENMEIGGVMQTTVPYTTEHLPKRILMQWMDYIDEAYAAIAPLEETNIGLYTTLKDRICGESMAIRFFLIDFYRKTFTTEAAQEMIDEFIYDAQRLEFAKFKESIPLSTVYDTWTA